ncbi:MAG TPA: radical SAM protein [Candidatus Polarisedimenticolaceae bacterium]|nr:radical SAM protein [Candidatus Polarisedimenticolaceae bacterium]
MRPLRIYLGDLTYTTVSLANEAFPLNIGYVAAYARETHGDSVEIELFKYPDELERAVRTTPPDILGLSNYPWNHSLDLEFFRLAHRLRADTLCVMGGSNIPHEADRQQAFLEQEPEIDIYVYLEGEVGFSNVVQRVLDSGSTGARGEIRSAPIDGCLFVDDDGRFVRGTVIPRSRSLDEYPSPYLTGILDKFFDGKLSPMMESNRGCPFSCTFCHEGHDVYRKVNHFSLDRVKAELEYIADRVTGPVHNLMFCDPNFGMYSRDLEICKTIARIQAERGWPRDIFATTGKNKKDRIAESLSILNGTMQMWISVQSMDETVLKNIKRENISLEDMMNIQSSLTANYLPSKSEIILGLPGETYDSHIADIGKLVTAGVDTITPYTLMLLHGTEMNTPAEREKWGFKTRYRVLPRDFGRMGDGRTVVEAEEVVVGTKDLSEDEYVALRRFHLIIATIYNGKPFAALFRLLKERRIDVFPLLKAILENSRRAPSIVRRRIEEFERETRGELWNSDAEMREFYADDKNFERLVTGELGANLLQKYVALSLIDTDAWARYVFEIAAEYLAADGASADTVEALDDIRRYCTARVHNLFGPDRLEDSPRATLRHDIEAWCHHANTRPLADFRFDAPREMIFTFSEEQHRTTDDYIERFGRSHQGIGKMLTKMNIMNAWRRCVPPDRTTMKDRDEREVYYALIDENASGGVIARHDQ